MMKRFFVFILVISGLTIQSLYAKCEEETCGLTVRGKVTSIEGEADKRSVILFAKLDVEFVNKGRQPIILFINEFPDGYWLGGFSLYVNNKDDEESIFSDGHWQSVDGGPRYKALAANLDTKTPAEGSTKLLQPNESWKFEDELRMYFELDTNYSIPRRKSWKEMQELPSKLWLTIGYELNPWNVEYFKPDLIRKLRKRWESQGNVLVENKKSGRFNHFSIGSEPFQIDLSQAKIRQVSKTDR